ncbi:UNVERIFIED_CONTAM: hypothetical protein Sradi_2535400 [Sesamum radiatum]|uniref:Uncharacterized protein n=1 Tax=Sesamum radiatum TaxID=300843 RepID=A0AAW2SKS0_SESRA
MLNAAVWNVRGLNRRDHQIAVRELAMNSKLHFLGLLEIRVTLPNAVRVQNGILPRWKWFSDYNSAGYRVWLAWDDGFIDIAIMDIGVQFVHCRIFIRSSHIYVLVTVSYGANDVGSRGDFNAVRDLSEVCGTSGDIRLAMNEFNDCILNTGLIALPMRGERFTWHNCSDDGRSLWKRLDCLLANDKWMERWPDVFYDCLTPRTSDHSPLVLCGDYRRSPVSMFRFDNYLALSLGFIDFVQDIWRHHIVGTPMYSVTRKLKALKPIFRQQRKKKGDLSANVKLAGEFLEIS